MHKPKLLILASGESDPDKGGSGFKKLAEAIIDGTLIAEIVAVVSNHPSGGVFTKATALKIPFEYSPRGQTADDYRRLVDKYQADYVALSGWLGLVRGLDPRTTFNIHPGPLPAFGGRGFFGHHVHEAVMESFRQGTLHHSEVCMHFVTPKYDDGPVFFRKQIPIFMRDDAESLGRRVNAMEHLHQARITNFVVQGQIHWDGVRHDSLRVPTTYLDHLPRR